MFPDTYSFHCRGQFTESTPQKKKLIENQESRVLVAVQIAVLRVIMSPDFRSWVSDRAPTGCSFLFSVSLLLLLVRVALKLRSLRFHSPRLCRIAVFLIQTNVSLIIFCCRSSYVSLHLGEHELSPLLRPLHLCDSVCSYLYDSLLLSLPATTRVGRSGSDGYCSLGFALST